MHFTTTGTNSLASESGVAHITRKRNRVKVYNNGEIYLKNGEKFEIELFNPTKSSLLAKIQINGSYISNSGLVVRPGERVYLERFIDSKNKFVFETYEIESTKESMRAVENNGKISIEFYSESLNDYSYTPDASVDLPKLKSSTGEFFDPSIYYKDNNISYGGTTVNNISFKNDSEYFTPEFESNISNLKYYEYQSSETGRVEKGEKSKQKFKNINASFYSSPASVTEYKILPKSKKPIESKDLRNYCVSCGTRIRKKSWKFCPACGDSVD